MLNPEDPNVRLAQFGRQVEMFFETDVGNFILIRCQEQIDSATKELKVADPYKPEEIQKIQNRIAVAESILNWLGEAIQEGKSAMEELKNAQN